MKKIKIPKSYLKILNHIIFLFILCLCLLLIVLNVSIDTILMPFKINAILYSLIKYRYIMLLYSITSIIIIKVIFDIYLLYDAGKSQGYYEIKIKLPKLVKKESNVGKYK